MRHDLENLLLNALSDESLDAGTRRALEAVLRALDHRSGTDLNWDAIGAVQEALPSDASEYDRGLAVGLIAGHSAVSGNAFLLDGGPWSGGARTVHR